MDYYRINIQRFIKLLFIVSDYNYLATLTYAAQVYVRKTQNIKTNSDIRNGMFSVVLVLVLTKLPIGWKQVVFEHFTGVLELGSRGGIYATAGKNCARLVCYSFNVGLVFFFL